MGKDRRVRTPPSGKPPVSQSRSREALLLSSPQRKGVNSTRDRRPARDSETWLIKAGEMDPSRRTRPFLLRSLSIALRILGKTWGHSCASSRTISSLLSMTRSHSKSRRRRSDSCFKIVVHSTQRSCQGGLTTLTRTDQRHSWIGRKTIGNERRDQSIQHLSCILELPFYFANEECVLQMLVLSLHAHRLLPDRAFADDLD